MRQPIRTLLWAAVLATTAAAQDINIDFSTEPTKVPPPSFAGAGQPGVWNAINPLPAGPAVSVVDVSGAPTGVTIFNWWEFGPTLSLINDPVLPPDVNDLLSDGFAVGDLPDSLIISGLQRGEYDVVLYGQVPTHSWETWFLGLPGGDQMTSGFWPGQFVEGNTHIRSRVFLPEGNLTVSWALPFFEPGFGWFSGMQLDRVWKDQGGGTTGVNGAPKLTMSGALMPNTPLTLSMQDGPPSAFSIVFINVDSSAPAPFLGGVLHAFPVTAQVIAFTDANGSLGGSVTFDGAPSGTALTFQVGMLDATVPIFGASLSNAVTGYAF